MVAVCAVLVLAGCATGTGPAAAPAPASPAPAPAAPQASAAPTPGRPDHVLIVVLENKDEGDAMSEGPYLRSLAASGAVLTDMHAETHPSQANYLALFSGSTQGVGGDACPLTLDGPNLATRLADAGQTFAGYAEDLPEAGFPGCRAGGYVRRHVPWASFRSVPTAANQPLTAMPADPSALPTVSFLIPNLCHDMHDCSIAEGDAWLRGAVDGYAQWARTHNSLLLVTFDESESDDDTDNHIATVAVGEHVVPGPVAGRTDHYGLLRTLEDLYGLPPLGRSAAASATPALWRVTT
jgi:acid phosphatase